MGFFMFVLYLSVFVTEANDFLGFKYIRSKGYFCSNYVMYWNQYEQMGSRNPPSNTLGKKSKFSQVSLQIFIYKFVLFLQGLRQEQNWRLLFRLYRQVRGGIP
jgi:hypothetical protein